jgi:hypothetical protein
VILDIGAGSGFFSKSLLACTSATEAWCIDTSYICDSERSENGKSLYFRREIDYSKANLVLLMDVLEHVIDDQKLLHDYSKKISSGTHILITVPAFNFLWSNHDVFLGHQRRYTLNDLEDLVKASGLKINQSFYYYGLIFPIALVIRFAKNLTADSGTPLKSELKKHNYLTNYFLAFLCRLELLFMRRNKFFGLTIFCLAEKI